MDTLIAKTSRKVLPPGGRIRVLVVDDYVVIRRLISHALTEDPHIEVVGTAADGSIALQRIPQYQPDVITLDVEMPGMDGLETCGNSVRVTRPFTSSCSARSPNAARRPR